MILPIHEVGAPVLRGTARELSVEDVLSDGVQDLIASMRDTMLAAPGVGLAAPQIGLPLQLAVIEDRADYIAKVPEAQALARQRRPVPFHVLVNPRLTVLEGAGIAHFFEGCLSLPGFTGVVGRALRVRVDCLNEKAEPVTIEAEGWYARILQHEIDHLKGTLYIDRMDVRTFSNKVNYERYWAAAR